MSNTVKLKRSSVPGKVPTITDLTAAEVAINTADKRVFFGTGLEVVEFATSGTHDLVVKGRFTTNSAGSSTIDILPVAAAKSMEYTIVATSGVNYQMVKLLVLHNGSVASILEYGDVVIGSNVFTVDVTISGGNVNLVCSSSFLPVSYTFNRSIVD